MSEKTAEQAPPRPSENTTEKALTRPASAGETALSPAERAEREIAKLDEEMDAILDRKPNREALVNPPGQALQPPQGRSITPSVSAPIPASHLNHMILNCIVPGSGSLLHGNLGIGLAQLGMAVAAVPMLFVKFWLALLLAVMAYVWSVASGLKFLSTPDSQTWK